MPFWLSADDIRYQISDILIEVPIHFIFKFLLGYQRPCHIVVRGKSNLSSVEDIKVFIKEYDSSPVIRYLHNDSTGRVCVNEIWYAAMACGVIWVLGAFGGGGVMGEGEF